MILVTVHEFGHYIFARMFGIKVNRFYLFFNPWFSLLKYDPRKGQLQIIGYTRDENGIETQHAWKTLQIGRPHFDVFPGDCAGFCVGCHVVGVAGLGYV